MRPVKLYEIKEILDSKVLVGANFLDRWVTAGGAADLLDRNIPVKTAGSLLITGFIAPEAVPEIIRVRLGAIALVRGKIPSEDLLSAARKHGVPILQTDYTMFTASGLLYIRGLRGLDGSW